MAKNILAKLSLDFFVKPSSSSDVLPLTIKNARKSRRIRVEVDYNTK